MLPNLDIVEEIWSYSPEGKPSIELRSKDKWGILSEVPKAQPHGTDLYFSPLKFDGRRTNDNTVRMGVLFADLDPVEPRTLNIEPSVAWETSPGSYQAAWYLSIPWDFYAEWAEVNRRLTYHTGADKGGWMGSKLLRWPGSFNWKREKDGYVPYGKIISHSRIEYRFQELREALPEIESKPGVTFEAHPPVVDPRELNWLLRSNWKDLSLRARAMVTKVRVNDRSLHIVRTANELASCGIPPVTAFHIIWVQPWNKWRTDRYNPGRLWQEVNAAARI